MASRHNLPEGSGVYNEGSYSVAIQHHKLQAVLQAMGLLRVVGITYAAICRHDGGQWWSLAYFFSKRVSSWLPTNLHKGDKVEGARWLVSLSMVLSWVFMFHKDLATSLLYSSLLTHSL
jgi:hypothetical protein